MPGIGPQHSDVHFEFEKRLDAYRDDVSSMLARKSIEELRSDYLKSIGSVHNPLTKTSGVHFKLCKELNDIRKTRPPWFGSGWSEREHLLDVDYWIAAETVSLDEAALLLVGVDPRKTNYEALFDGYGRDHRINEVLYFLEDCFELLARRFGDPDDGFVEIGIRDLCEWVLGTSLKVSNELGEIIKRRKFAVDSGRKNRTSPDQGKPTHGRSRMMFQRALLAVAIDQYGFKGPNDSARVARAIAKAGYYVAFDLDWQNLATHIRAGFSQIDKGELAEWQKKQDEN
jgi:hypothetical protein